MSLLNWQVGTLKTSEYGYDFGHILFYRPMKTRRKLAVGVAYWVKFQGSNQIFSFAESYSGVNLQKMVAPMRDPRGGFRKVPLESSNKLDALLRTFLIKLPPGALLKQTSTTEDEKSSLKRTTKLAT